jgi:hypothetical protein
MLGNETTITCYGQGNYGMLRNVSYVSDLRMNLLSTKHLCIDNDFLVNFNKERAQIIHKNTLDTKGMKHAIITTASLQADNLYHVHDITKFLSYKVTEHSNINTIKEVNRDDLKGSAHIQYKNTIKDMDPLEALHVRLGTRKRHQKDM